MLMAEIISGITEQASVCHHRIINFQDVSYGFLGNGGGGEERKGKEKRERVKSRKSSNNVGLFVLLNFREHCLYFRNTLAEVKYFYSTAFAFFPCASLP